MQPVFDDGLLVGVGDTRPADPRTAVPAQQGFQRGDEPAGTAFPGGGAVGQPFQVDRQPVGDDDEIRAISAAGDATAVPAERVI